MTGDKGMAKGNRGPYYYSAFYSNFDRYPMKYELNSAHEK